jgi:hypothetical protein
VQDRDLVPEADLGHAADIAGGDDVRPVASMLATLRVARRRAISGCMML